MKAYFLALVGLTVISFVSAILQRTNGLIIKSELDYGGSSTSEPTFHETDTIEPGQNRVSQNNSLTDPKCVCVPYYRCDPGHWEKTELDPCTRFMYICCYGAEALIYLANQVDDDTR